MADGLLENRQIAIFQQRFDRSTSYCSFYFT